MFNSIKRYKRKIIQLTCAIIYNINFKGFKNVSIYKGNVKNICVPGLNCYSCPGAIASCPIGSLQNIFVNSKYKYSLFDKIPFYVIGLLVVFGIIFGRIICGFLCPFGLIQELIYKIKTPKIRKNKISAKLIYIKYIILLIFVIIIPLIMFYPGFCKFICPVGTLEAGLFFVTFDKNLREIIGLLFSVKIIILITILTMSIFMYRFFCRFICPLGAFYSLFNKISIFGLKIDSNRCTNCGECVNKCLMDVKKLGDRECIECGECIKHCKVNAIGWKKL